MNENTNTTSYHAYMCHYGPNGDEVWTHDRHHFVSYVEADRMGMYLMDHVTKYMEYVVRESDHPVTHEFPDGAEGPLPLAEDALGHVIANQEEIISQQRHIMSNQKHIHANTYGQRKPVLLTGE